MTQDKNSKHNLEFIFLTYMWLEAKSRSSSLEWQWAPQARLWSCKVWEIVGYVDKTETILFNFSLFRFARPPFPYSNSVRNLGFYLDNYLSMKEHINFISWKSEVLVLFTTTSLVMAPKLLLFLSYSHTLTIATLSWLVFFSPWYANFRDSKTVRPIL